MREINIEFVCRAEGDTRYISGIAMPWNEEIIYRGQRESFAPGGLVPRSGKVPLRYGHQKDPEGFPIPVGVLTRSVDTEHGLWIEARMLNTSSASDAWEAASEGLVGGFSVEFSRSSGIRGNVGQGRVTDGVMNGVVLTERPAYKSATISSVRSKSSTYNEWDRWYKNRRLGEWQRWVDSMTPSE